MPKDKILSLLGLAAKAGKVASGGFAAEEALKAGRASLVILAGDASDNTCRRFEGLCRSRKVPCFRYSEKETLGKAIGRGERTVAAVTDGGFAVALGKLWKDIHTEPVEEGIYGE